MKKIDLSIYGGGLSVSQSLCNKVKKEKRRKRKTKGKRWSWPVGRIYEIVEKLLWAAFSFY